MATLLIKATCLTPVKHFVSGCRTLLSALYMRPNLGAKTLGPLSDIIVFVNKNSDDMMVFVNKIHFILVFNINTLLD